MKKSTYVIFTILIDNEQTSIFHKLYFEKYKQININENEVRSRRAKDAAGNKNKMREQKGRKKKRKPVTRKVSRQSREFLPMSGDLC